MTKGGDAFLRSPPSLFSVCRRPQRRGTPSTSKAMNNAKNTTLFPYLERLLEGEVVEWKTLGEVCDILRGKRVTKKELSDEGKYAVFQNSMIPLGHYHKSNVSGDTTFVICAGSAGEIGYSKEYFWAADDVYYFACPNHIISKYLYYFLCTKQSQILRQVRKASIPRLSKQALEKLLFPIPPLRVQARIVEILDKFTQLEAELEKELAAELEARKKQYAYYRDQLLNFLQSPPLNVNIEWKMLGEVAEIGTGSSNRQDEAENGVYPFYVRSKNILRSSTYQFDETAIIIPGEGGIGDIFHYTEGKYALHQRAYRIKVNAENELFPKFLFYYMTNAFKPFILARCVGATATSIRKPMLADFPIPLPPLSEQRRIVDILDRFDTLTNSISEGLPKEIALRRKQYAYYRDALLSFPRPEASA